MDRTVVDNAIVLVVAHGVVVIDRLFVLFSGIAQVERLAGFAVCEKSGVTACGGLGYLIPHWE